MKYPQAFPYLMNGKIRKEGVNAYAIAMLLIAGVIPLIWFMVVSGMISLPKKSRQVVPTVQIGGNNVNSVMVASPSVVPVGLVMGGIQSLSRSTYSKLIYTHQGETTSFFSFYDVVDKISTLLGKLKIS